MKYIIEELDKRMLAIKNLMESKDYNYYMYPYNENEIMYKTYKDLKEWILINNVMENK
jgi:predicted nuclease with RNAse H fold